jgi:S-DNA-T family DNA segregation ATPase FtsK/SpoIIIE
MARKAKSRKERPAAPARGAKDRRAARLARLKEVLGVGCIILTFAAIISLASYDPTDPSWNAAVPDRPVHNFVGPLGAKLADALAQLFGFGAWLFPIFSFGAAVLCFVNLAAGLLTWIGRIGGLTVFSLSLVALGNLAFTAPDPFFPSLKGPAGGVAGDMLVRLALPQLREAGTALLFAFFLVASFTLATHLTPKRLALASWAAAAALAARIRAAIDLGRGRKEKEKVRQRRTEAEEELVAETELLPEPEPEAADGEEEDPAPSGPKIVHRPPPPRKKAPAAVRRPDGGPGQGAYVLPPLDLLDDPPDDRQPVSREEVNANARTLEKKLEDFGVTGRVTEVRPGPVITMYEYEPAAGVKINRIVGLQDDLALALSAMSIRVGPIPGKSVVGIELPNRAKEMVTLKEVMLSETFQKNRSKLAVALGKDIFGAPKVADLVQMPHVLIAGQTGSGKSVMINTVIASILFSAKPDEVQFIMIDPKMVELTMYDGIPHLIAPVVSNAKKAAYALRNAVGIMEERLRILAEKKVRNIATYNEHVLRENKAAGLGTPPALMPYLVIVIDELADLMILAQNEVEDSITRLAQLSRAVGMHLVIATQRPSTNVITGIIKANLPVRMSFQVSSKIDSRVILDSNGAEQLLGKGDMLYVPPGSNRLERIHGAFVSEEEVKRLVDHLKAQARPTYNEALLQPPPSAEEAEGGDGEQDEMYDQAVAVVTKSGQASISYVQRQLKVGYNRAARMIEAMEKAGLVSPADGAKPRKILARRGYEEE